MRKGVLYFLGGFGIGAAIGSLVGYLIATKKAEKDFWDNNANDEDEEDTNEISSDGINEEYKKDRNYINGESKKYETPPEIKEKLLKNWEVPSFNVSDKEAAEHMHPVDSDEDYGESGDVYEKDDENEENEYTNDPENMTDEEYEEEMEMIEAKNAYEERQKNKDKEPEIIFPDNLGAVPPSFDEEEWIFWAEDDVITDENEEEIKDYQRFIGNLMNTDNFKESDEDELYVISYEYECVYHIVKYFRSYSEQKMQEMGYIEE